MIDAGHEKNVSDAQARKSVLVVAGALLIFAAWNFYRARFTVGLVLSVAAGMLLVVGLILPPFIAHRFHRVWMSFAAVLGYINSRILLTLMYFGVFAPYGIISRLVGRDPLNRRQAKCGSYWVVRQKTRQTKEGFERLF